MRHITPARLDTIDDLLAQLRMIDGLVERKRGSFYLSSRAFLHFHEHGDEIYADIRLNGETFDRRRATTRAEQRALVTVARRAAAARFPQS